jgi:hypothetical protein
MTLIPAKHTFKIWQGSTFFEVFTRYDTDGTGQPFDFCSVVNGTRVAHYTAEMVIRNKRNGTPLLTLKASYPPAVGDGIIFLTDLNEVGQIALLLENTTTAGITWKSGVYDLTVTDVSLTPNVTSALLYGSVQIEGI